MTEIDKKHITLLRSFIAYEDGIEFAEQFDSLADAWDRCKRPDWMLWLLKRETGKLDQKQVLRFYVEYSIRVCKSMPINDGRKLIDLMTDPRSVAAVEMAEKWLKGEATHEELAATAAYAAYAATAADATAAHAGHAAAYAVRTATAAHAGHAAAYAVRTATAATAAYAAYAARAADAAYAAAVRSWQADLIRGLIGNPYKEVVL